MLNSAERFRNCVISPKIKQAKRFTTNVLVGKEDFEELFEVKVKI